MGVLFLGIDGLGFEGLRALNSLGFFGDLRDFANMYFSSKARTTFPPQTIPAWISLFTGVNPGKHGVFSFFSQDHGAGIHDNSDIKFPPVYEVLSALGRRVLIDAVPLSFPPYLKIGVATPDWLSRSRHIYVRHPQSRVLQRIFSGYPFSDPTIKNLLGWRRASTIFARKLRRRIETLLDVLERDFFDDYFIVFSELDWVFHSYYSRFVIRRPPKFLKPLLSALDYGVSKLIKLGKRRGLTIFVGSDHGFRVYRKLIMVNDILYRLRLASGVKIKFVTKKKPVKKALESDGVPLKIAESIYELAVRFGISRVNPPKIYNKLLRIGLRAIPNPKQSRAFALLNIPAVFISVHPNYRRPRILSKLKNLLRRVRINGENIFELVATKNDIYRGPYTKLAPDIGIFGSTRNGYLTSAILLGTTVMERRTNYHDFDAIFITNASIQRVDHVSIYDFAPTIYGSLGIPVQRESDGRDLTFSGVGSMDYRKRWSVTRRLLRFR